MLSRVCGETLQAELDPLGNLMNEPTATIEEFIAWTEALHGGMILYRGLANAEWDVESSAYRRIKNSEAISSEIVPTVTFQNYIDHLLDDASLQGFRVRQDKRLSDLELLAELQHYGAATCLIDFSSSSLIALWFACQEESGQTGRVIAMATNSADRFSTIRYEDLDKPIKEFLNQGKLWKWEPSGLNNRIVAQQSVFVFGEGKIEKIDYEEFTVAAACKKGIIEALDKSFGIRGPKLFNDLAGFAHHNAHDQPYNKFIAEDFLFFGQMFHQQGEYQQAIERYSRAIELDSQLAMAYYNRGTAKNTLSDHYGAIADLNEAIERNLQDASAYNNRGIAKFGLGDRQGAIADYDRAIALDPQLAVAFYNRGYARHALGDYLTAIADYDRAIVLNPQDWTMYHSRGNAKLALGDYLRATADYDQAIVLNPQDWALYYNRGYARHALGDYLRAIADYDQAIVLNPNFAGLYNIRGNARFALNDYLGATADYERVIELYPQDVIAYFNRANARRNSGDLYGAIADYNSAIGLNPLYAEAYVNRGIAKRSIGDEAGANKDFAQANAINQNLHPPEQ